MKRDAINELYYARNNVPTFPQFKKTNYQFVDDAGRQYMIATKNRQVLENARFRNNRVSGETSIYKEPVVDNYDLAKLFVKLPSPDTPWFTYADIGREMILHDRVGGRSYLVTLKKQERGSPRRSGLSYGPRTGSAWIRGLDNQTLTNLLNQ